MENRDVNHPNKSVQPKAIVCLYAQRDEPWYRELQTYLVLWQNQGHIYWADPASIHQADLVLLLLSPDFFAARRCQRGMMQAFEARTERGIPVVPVLARVSNWKESACGALKALPDNDRPIAEWRQKERAYENICAGLARFLPDLPALGIAPPERPRLFQAPKLSESYVARPNEFAATKQLLLHQQGTQTTAITTALRGAGGFGKTTLAQAVCHDPEIQAAFPDGILWVELGEHPRRPLDVLNGLLAALEPSHAKAVTVEETKQRWQAALRDRVCLLVIDDVWQAETLLPLLEGGPHCRRLVTTRNDLLLPKDAARVLVDAMEPHEAVAVLCQGLPEAIRQATSLSNLEVLAARLGCWPLLLTLANGLLTDLVVEAHATLAQALTTLAQAYQTRGVTAFRLDNVGERQRTVNACLSVSLQYLETFTHAHYHALERYQELAIFPEDTDIPLRTLEIFWKGTGMLEPWETKDLCTRLHRLSLLLTCDLGKGTIRLHDVVRSYLIQRAGAHLPTLHVRLLDAYWKKYGLARWAELPRNDWYIWQHLIFHLCQVGHQGALQAPFTDLIYLTRKALYRGVSELEADLLLANVTPPTGMANSTSSFFAILHRHVVGISHLLRQAQTEAEMGGLLLSHLGSHPLFTTRRAIWEREFPRPFLTAWHPLPNGSSSALLRTLRGHTSMVTSCAVSLDSRFIVSASMDKTLKIWDAVTGAERHTLTGHKDIVWRCILSPDGTFIISASEDGTLKLWDAATGVELYTLAGHSGPLTDCAVSPDSTFIVSASMDQTLKVWDAATGAERFTLTGHIYGANRCVVSPNGRFIVSASHGPMFKVWDTASGAERHTLTYSGGQVTGCEVSSDGRFIVSASEDGTLKLWNATTGVEYLTFRELNGRVSCCAVSPNGRFIVSASPFGPLKVWDATTRAERQTLTDRISPVIQCVVSLNGRFIVSTSLDGTFKVWDAVTGAELRTLTGHSGVRACGFSPDGKWIVSASYDKTLKLWDAATGVERHTLTGHTNWVKTTAFSPDGKWIVSASEDLTLKVWDAATGTERFTLTGHTSVVNDCAVSPDSRFIVSASGDCTLKVWDVATGAERLTLTGHTNPVEACAVSPDGRFIVSASVDYTLRLWDAATGAELRTLIGHSGPLTGCAVSPDSRFIVSTSYHDYTLKLWDGQTGRCVLTFPVDGGLYGCAFHPDGEHLVACGDLGMYFLRLVR